MLSAFGVNETKLSTFINEYKVSLIIIMFSLSTLYYEEYELNKIKEK